MNTNYFYFLFNSSKKRYLLYSVIVIFIISIAYSCIKDDDFDNLATEQWSSEWAVPLVNTRLTLSDLLDDSISEIIEDSNHFLTIVYETGELASFRAMDQMEIPEQSINTEDSVVIGPINPGGVDSIFITRPYSFITPEPGQHIDSIFISNGTMQVNITSQINHTIQIKLSILSATNNGQILELVIPLIYQGNLPVTASQSINLAGYKILFDNSPGKNNEVMIRYGLYVTGDTNVDQSPYYINFGDKFMNFEFSKLFGYFGNYTYPLSDTMEIDIFNNSLYGSFNIEEIKTYITTSNSYGMPIGATINSFKAIGLDGLPVEVLPPGTNLYVPNPSISQMGQYADTTYLFDETNSGIANAINASPKTFIFDIVGVSNPLNDTTIYNFVLDSSTFRTSARVEVPMFVSIDGFILEDTIDFELSNIESVEELTFAINTENGFPFDSKLQIYFADSNNTVLDSISSSGIVLNGGAVGPAPNYKVVTPSSNFNLISLDQAQLDNLGKTKKLFVRAHISTTNGQKVKIYGDNYIDLKLGAKVKYRLKFGN